MKGILWLALAVAGLYFGWMAIAHGVMADQVAHDFVEELRLGMDNGVLSSKFSYTPPLPEKQMTMPPGGIAPSFEVTRESGPVESGGATTITYRVHFDKSPVAAGRSQSYDYRLTLQNEGTRLLPTWTTVTFKPARRGSRENS